MKTLLVAEYRDGQLLGSYNELVHFSNLMAADSAMFLVGPETALPAYPGKLYLADPGEAGEFNPDGHKQLLLEVIAREQPNLIVLSHSSYGWDLAPRLALALETAQISEVVDIQDGNLVVPACNAKLQRQVTIAGDIAVVTLQSGAFTPLDELQGQPEVIRIDGEAAEKIRFHGYEAPVAGGVDLARADIIVSAGRGIGKPENLALIENLAQALKGEYGASRPVVDAEWADQSRQVGTTGQTVAPKLYVACGISGAIQHLAGMKKAEFVLAVNTDRDAPIGEIADVLAVADLKLLLPVLTEKINAL